MDVEYTWLHRDNMIDESWHIIYITSFYWSLASNIYILIYFNNKIN